MTSKNSGSPALSTGAAPAGRRLPVAVGTAVGAGAVVAALWIGVGLLITRSGVDGLDRSTALWLVDHRTPFLDGLTRAGTLMGQTATKVIVTVVAAAVVFVTLRSWRAVGLIVGSTVLEGAVFLLVTTVVGRPRPDVPRLEAVTVNSSFPSGHTGAAAAYAAIALVIVAHVRPGWARAVTVVLAVFVPVAVAASRIYRGAHYLTDVIAGLALGWVCVAIVFVIIRHWFGTPTGDQHAESRG